MALLDIKINQVLAVLPIVLLLLLGILGIYQNVDNFVLIDFTLIMVWFFVFHRDILLKYCFFFISGIWNIAAVFVLENYSIWMPNLQRYSYHSGSLFLLVMAFVVFALSLIVFDKKMSKSFINARARVGNRRSNRLYFLVTCLAFMALAILLIIAYRTGYFATGASSRYEFNASSNSIASALYTYIELAIPLIAIYAFRIKSKKIVFCFVGLYFILLILMGNKFAPLISAAYIFFLSFYYLLLSNSKDHNKKLENKAFALFFVLALLLLVYSLMQMWYEHANLEQGLSQLYDRIFTGQGDVWWGIYSAFSGSSTRLPEITDELQAFNSDNLAAADYRFGIYKMMYLVAPFDIFSQYVNNGIRFTSSTDATFYYYFGFLGVIIGKIIVAALISFVANKLIRACKYGYGIEAVIWVYIMVFLFRAYSMSEFYALFSTSAMLAYFILIGIYLARKAKRSNTEDKQQLARKNMI